MSLSSETAPQASAKRFPIERLALRCAEVAAALGLSRRAIECERRAGRFPPPDLHVGRIPLWRIEALKDWLSRGGR